MGFVFQQRTRHIQLRPTQSTLPVSRIRYRARTSPPQNPESRETLQKFAISPSAEMENVRRKAMKLREKKTLNDRIERLTALASHGASKKFATANPRTQAGRLSVGGEEGKRN
jgi:hypothetical protein